ncbi:MAG: glycosyltransferase family 2 protein [Caldilineaceae bacterium]|nr:glycosyltransferase family 2 protein [Caldilineaceae bacterium]
MATKLTLSIIICTKDREAVLRDTLATLFDQTRLPEELLLIDDGNLPVDELVSLVEAKGIPCHYYKKETPGLVASRNLGVEQAKGDIILFLDDDVLLEPDYLAALMAVYEADPNGAIGGVEGALSQEYAPGVLPFLRFFGLDSKKPGEVLPSGSGVLTRQGDFDQPISVEWLSGCDMSYRRAVFADMRFDGRLSEVGYAWADDLDFSYRVSKRWQLIATPAARLVHRKEPSGRINTYKMGFIETNYFWRFFAKNMPKRPRNWRALCWALTGIVLKNGLLLLTKSARRATLMQLYGNFVGLAAIFTGKDFR